MWHKYIKMKKLILRIGLPKTGGSAIRQSLFASDELLKEQKFVHIDLHIIPGLPVPKEHNATDELKEYTIRHINSYEADYSDHTALCTFESLSGHEKKDNTQEQVDFIKGILEGTNFDEVQILVYLRNQTDFIQSLYTQYIHEGEVWSFEEFLNEVKLEFMNWKRFVGFYQSEWGDAVTVIPYDKNLLTGGNTVDDFMARFGIAKYKKVQDWNSGYSRDALELARLCYPHINNEDQRVNFRYFLQNHFSKQKFEKYNYFTTEYYNDFMANYYATNKEMNQKYFDGNKVLLEEMPNPDSLPPQYSGLSIEAAAPILVKFMLTANDRINVHQNAIQQIVNAFNNMPVHK